MRNYVLTERGKILVASLIAFFLILPSLILVIFILPRVSSSNGPNQGSGDALKNNPGEPSSSIQTTPDNSRIGTVVIDLALAALRVFDADAGIMTFTLAHEMSTRTCGSTRLTTRNAVHRSSAVAPSIMLLVHHIDGCGGRAV